MGWHVVDVAAVVARGLLGRNWRGLSFSSVWSGGTAGHEALVEQQMKEIVKEDADGRHKHEADGDLYEPADSKPDCSLYGLEHQNQPLREIETM